MPDTAARKAREFLARLGSSSWSSARYQDSRSSASSWGFAMPSDPSATAAGSPHKWVHRGSMGNDWWACECGAMSADDEHPEQGGKVARSGDGVHYDEVAFFPSPKYRIERVQGGYRVLSSEADGTFS